MQTAFVYFFESAQPYSINFGTNPELLFNWTLSQIVRKIEAIQPMVVFVPLRAIVCFSDNIQPILLPRQREKESLRLWEPNEKKWTIVKPLYCQPIDADLQTSIHFKVLRVISSMVTAELNFATSKASQSLQGQVSLRVQICDVTIRVLRFSQLNLSQLL